MNTLALPLIKLNVKKLLIIFTYLITCFNSYGQEISRVFKSPSQDFSISRIIEASEHRLFASIGHNNSFDQFCTEQWIYALDFELNTLDSVSIDQYLNVLPGDNYRIAGMKVKEGNLYAIFNILNPTNPTYYGDQYRSALVKLDSNLNLLQKLEVFNDSLVQAFFDFEIDENKNVYAFGSSYPRGGYWDPTVYKINENLNLVKTQVFDSLPESQYGQPSHLTRSTIAGSTLVCYSALVGNLKRLGNLALDTNLNIVGYGSLNVDSTAGPFGIFQGGNHHFYSINEDSIYAYGVFFSPIPSNLASGYFTLGFSKLDSAFNTAYVDTTMLLPGITPFTSPDPWVYKDPGDARSPDSLFVAINGWEIFGPYFYDQDSNSFYLYNYNLRQNKLNWRKKITTGLTNGWHSVEALPGNRYALAFSQYDWKTKNYPNLEVHFWILNGSGDILSSRAFKRPLQKWALYPNPSSQAINLPKEATQSEELSYRLLNSNGQVVKSGSIPQGQHSISIQILSPGNYFLETPLGVGLFVKE